MPSEGHFRLSQVGLFQGGYLTGFLSPILLRKLIEVLRAGGFVPEREGSSETWDVGMVRPLGKLTSESALALCIKVQVLNSI